MQMKYIHRTIEITYVLHSYLIWPQLNFPSSLQIAISVKISQFQIYCLRMKAIIF